MQESRKSLAIVWGRVFHGHLMDYVVNRPNEADGLKIM